MSAKHPHPQEGGSFIRHKDGRLEKLEGTRPQAVGAGVHPEAGAQAQTKQSGVKEKSDA
jgi:hypothetical protein